MVRRRLADMVSFSRIVLLVPWIWSELDAGIWALPFMAIIIASDLLDGPIARRLSTACGRGALIDAACDAFVVIAAAVTIGLSDPRYLWLAGCMAVAIVSWGAHSLILGRFAYTRLGRYDGVLCYAVVVAASARPWLLRIGISLPAAVEWAPIALAAAVLAISTVENCAGALSGRRVLTQPAERSRQIGDA